MKLIFLSMILALAATAQTTVTITINVVIPTVAGQVANAWRQSQCAAFDSATPPACLSLKWPTVSAMIKELVSGPAQAAAQGAVNSTLATAAQWAITTNDASVPAAVKTAIIAKAAAQATIDAASAGTATGQ
jgi:hypothetical protein